MAWYDGFIDPIKSLTVGKNDKTYYQEVGKILQEKNQQREKAQQSRKKSPSVGDWVTNPSGSGQYYENKILSYIVMGLIALFGINILMK